MKKEMMICRVDRQRDLLEVRENVHVADRIKVYW